MKKTNSILNQTNIVYKTVLFSLLSVVVQAQDNNKPAPITNKQKTEIIDLFASNLNKKYVFPDVALKIENKIKSNNKKGLYSKINDGRVFADSISNEASKISNDKHLRVFYRPEAPAVNAATDSIEIKKRDAWRRQFLIHFNFGFTKIAILDGNVGYLKIDGFVSVKDVEKIISSAMTFLTNTDAIILDLTDNRGGEPETVRLVASYFFAPEPVHINDIYFREENKTEEFWTLKDISGERYLNKPVYVLTGNQTFSGGEEFAYDLQILKRATIVGQTTKGGANPGETFPLKDGFSAFIPTGKAINPITKTNWEGTGVKPDIELKPENIVDETHILALKKLIETTEDIRTKKFFEDTLDKISKK
ncbi:hypothetical protein AR687_24990 [Flavobacteriaceae bacterium CRH]|nr:hypothetical protein AR687_24990 [Flavobacteriaceae bacterium CRH]